MDVNINIDESVDKQKHGSPYYHLKVRVMVFNKTFFVPDRRLPDGPSNEKALRGLRRSLSSGWEPSIKTEKRLRLRGHTQFTMDVQLQPAAFDFATITKCTL